VDYTTPRRCICQREFDEARRQEAYQHLCTLPDGTEERTLANFHYGHSGDLKAAYDCSVGVVEGQVNFLTLVAKSDRGKTHLGIAICREWMQRRKVAKYVFVPLLLKDLKSGFNNQEGEQSYDYKLDFYMKVALLVLDDLGVENETNWVIQELETIIDYRYIHNLPTVVTTNLSLPQLNAKYGSERVTSRLKRAKNARIVVIDSSEFISVRGTL
jgi:DNA replication protein DnaC